MKTTTTLRLDTEEYIQDPDNLPEYVDALGLIPLYEALEFGSSLGLIGPKGIGKTLSFVRYAAERSIPIVTYDCSEDVRRSQLIGSYILQGEETPFVLGPVPTAIDIANERGKCILCFEELNALSPQCQKILNPIADFRRRIEIPEAQRVFKLDPEADIWVVATMNSTVYGGVYALNEDLKSRFNMIPCSYPSIAEEEEILRQTCPEANQLPDQLLQGVLNLAKETREPRFEYSLSTRDLVQVVRNFTKIGPRRSLWIVSGKFEEEDKDLLKTRVGSIFAFDLDDIDDEVSQPAWAKLAEKPTATENTSGNETVVDLTSHWTSAERESSSEFDF